MKGLGADTRYWQALGEGHLEMQRCSHCQKWHWPAAFRCGDCGSWEHEWLKRDLSGTIYSWTRTWHEFGAPPEIPRPFVTVVVTLDDTGDCRLMGVLDTADKDVAIGQRVTGAIYQVSIEEEKIPALRWRQVKDEHGETAQ